MARIEKEGLLRDRDRGRVFRDKFESTFVPPISVANIGSDGFDFSVEDDNGQ